MEYKDEYIERDGKKLPVLDLSKLDFSDAKLASKGKNYFLVIPNYVDRPCVIKNVYGEGKHQFLNPGDIIVKKVLGENSHQFLNSSDIMEDDLLDNIFGINKNFLKELKIITKEDYQKGILEHPLTKPVSEGTAIYYAIKDNQNYNAYRSYEQSDAAAFVVRITDILSEDVKRLLAEHAIKIGDIIYINFYENEENEGRKEYTKEIIDSSNLKKLGNFEQFSDYEIAKLEDFKCSYECADPFFINDSIAKKILGDIFVVPQKVFKKSFQNSNNEEKEM